MNFGIYKISFGRSYLSSVKFISALSFVSACGLSGSDSRTRITLLPNTLSGVDVIKNGFEISFSSFCSTVSGEIFTPPVFITLSRRPSHLNSVLLRISTISLVVISSSSKCGAFIHRQLLSFFRMLTPFRILKYADFVCTFTALSAMCDQVSVMPYDS